MHGLSRRAQKALICGLCVCILLLLRVFFLLLFSSTLEKKASADQDSRQECPSPYTGPQKKSDSKQ